MDTIEDTVRGVHGACGDSVWHVDETRTLQIEVNGATLTPRRCELRRQPHVGLVAVKLDVDLNELLAASSSDVLTWRFTLRQGGALLRNQDGWKVAAMDEGGGTTYHLCLEPA